MTRKRFEVWEQEPTKETTKSEVKMTTKRFTIDDESDIIEFDWNTNEYIDDFRWGDGKSWDRICNKLNAQHEEITRLKRVNQKLYDKLQVTMSEKSLKGGEVSILKRENEQLKQKVDFYKYFQKDARELEKENEELKSELKIYRKIANCNNCEYHNYDWYDDGDEFEVCDKRNDMWYRICEDWRELE